MKAVIEKHCGHGMKGTLFSPRHKSYYVEMIWPWIEWTRIPHDVLKRKYAERRLWLRATVYPDKGPGASLKADLNIRFFLFIFRLLSFSFFLYFSASSSYSSLQVSLAVVLCTSSLGKNLELWSKHVANSPALNLFEKILTET